MGKKKSRLPKISGNIYSLREKKEGHTKKAERAGEKYRRFKILSRSNTCLIQALML